MSEKAATLEERVAQLETKVDRLLSGGRTGSWKETIGMFAGDDLMKEIDKEGRRIREEDRAAAIAELESEYGS